MGEDLHFKKNNTPPHVFVTFCNDVDSSKSQNTSFTQEKFEGHDFLNHRENLFDNTKNTSRGVLFLIKVVAIA